jgi:hypothetical protein
VASASRPMPDGRRPEPGGWNRFVIEVEDLPGLVVRLREAGVAFRTTSSRGAAAARSSARTPPATSSNCSNLAASVLY